MLKLDIGKEESKCQISNSIVIYQVIRRNRCIKR